MRCALFTLLGFVLAGLWFGASYYYLAPGCVPLAALGAASSIIAGFYKEARDEAERL